MSRQSLPFTCYIIYIYIYIYIYTHRYKKFRSPICARPGCHVRALSAWKCVSCKKVRYCSEKCRDNHLRMHSRQCVYIRGLDPDAWFIDTMGTYHWQPVLTSVTPGEFRPKVGSTLTVHLRSISDLMRQHDCNGCMHQHHAKRRHCSGYTGIAPASTPPQTIFNLFWHSNQDYHILYTLDHKRIRFPGQWSLHDISGIDEDGYKSGQALITCESI